ncbi:hypothetical protein SAMN05216215_101997 [Saccharopolyspora shandongensis]|uniref:Uncharacterized protein n=1 Tax=Saccharopolyspora shandongensis TaxID=418495 RepID=A0A1H3GWE5_9PSEU|nr:hypothetical protein [Saccharopolyspora shandongensis]SDY06968.1 hypothetical protein SAMN05216215_101997 [Saccharopolyspora shandongensis]
MATTTSSSTSSTSSGTSHRTRKQPPTRAGRAQGGTDITLPYVTAELHTTKVHLPGLPGRKELASAVDTVRGQLPSREQALFYGGLTAAAAFSLIEWPVAAAIGIGNALIQRSVHKEISEA